MVLLVEGNTMNTIMAVATTARELAHAERQARTAAKSGSLGQGDGGAKLPERAQPLR
jgi:hypothetical protein